MWLVSFIFAILFIFSINKLSAQNPIQASSTKTLNAGWYTIAKNTGNTANAKFSIREGKSSNHRVVHFYAQCHFGADGSNQINVLANSNYAKVGSIRYIRIVEGSTYSGAYVQAYLNVNSISNCYFEISENVQTSGWVLVYWEVATMVLPDNSTVTDVINGNNINDWDGDTTIEIWSNATNGYPLPPDITVELKKVCPSN